MANRRLRVGIIGVQPGRSWAAVSHIPALRALADTFDIAGIANTSRASAEAAATETGVARAYENAAELIAADDVDIVTVAVRVPAHFELVQAAIAAGKHVYCEWPLGNGLAEAEELARLARAKGVMGIVGTQATFAPEIEYARKLVADGFVGSVLSTSMVAWGGALQGGGTIPDRKTYGYLLERANGANLLTIPVGHALAAATSILGPVSSVSAALATRRPTARALDTGEVLTANVPDQVLLSAFLSDGVPLSLHFRGGAPRHGEGLFWEINGTEGDIRITGANGHVQLVPLSLEGVRDEETGFRRLAVPEAYRSGWPSDPEPGNVARVYAAMAHDLRFGTRSAPSFDDAVKIHHIVDAIERSAQCTGVAVS